MTERPPHPDDPGEPQHGHPRRGIGTVDEVILRALARGKRCLDIGTGLGYSARAMAETAAIVWTLDIDPWVMTTIWPDLPAKILTTTEVPSGPFDLVFIDGDHSVDAVVEDIRRAERVLAPYGLILLHDWDADPRVRMGAEAAHLAPVYGLGTDYGLGLYAQP